MLYEDNHCMPGIQQYCDYIIPITNDHSHKPCYNKSVNNTYLINTTNIIKQPPDISYNNNIGNQRPIEMEPPKITNIETISGGTGAVYGAAFAHIFYFIL